MELRCDSGILFGIIDEEAQTIEFKCRSTRCGAGPGVVVLHRFSLRTGELIDTKRFRNPRKERKE
jgi:hypothetical protein